MTNRHRILSALAAAFVSALSLMTIDATFLLGAVGETGIGV